MIMTTTIRSRVGALLCQQSWTRVFYGLRWQSDSDDTALLPNTDGFRPAMSAVISTTGKNPASRRGYEQEDVSQCQHNLSSLGPAFVENNPATVLFRLPDRPGRWLPGSAGTSRLPVRRSTWNGNVQSNAVADCPLPHSSVPTGSARALAGNCQSSSP
jgi:hypothetical protein